MYHVGSSPEVINETEYRAVFDTNDGTVAIVVDSDGTTLAESNGAGVIEEAEEIIVKLGYRTTDTGWWAALGSTFVGEYNRYVIPAPAKGRPPVGPIVPVRMPHDLLNRIDAHATQAGMTRSAAIRLACDVTYRQPDVCLCTLEVATTRDVLQSICRTATGGEMPISESGRLGLEITGGPVAIWNIKAELDRRGIESILEME